MKRGVLGIIPARFASSRFPGKVLAPIFGKSLIQTTYENALQCKELDRLIVATDDAKVFDHVKGFCNEVVMTSPSCVSGSDRAKEVVEKYGMEEEIVTVIQADEPCVHPKVISQLIRDLKNNKEAALTTPIEPILDVKEALSPGIVKCVFTKDFKALYFSRSLIPFSQKGEGKYYRHLGIYCYRKEFLLRFGELSRTHLQMTEDLEQLKVLEHGFPIYVSLIDPSGNIGVDYPEDIQKVEAFLCRNTSL